VDYAHHSQLKTVYLALCGALVAIAYYVTFFTYAYNVWHSSLTFGIFARVVLVLGAYASLELWRNLPTPYRAVSLALLLPLAAYALGVLVVGVERFLG